MDFKDLLSSNLGKSLGHGDGRISHGLNLVLKLKNPADMPMVLAGIERKRRKINDGLGELNFVHFARFLPTHDDTALQVITEFDGPLAPYVLDFAIEIGDVFDMLLGYTQGTQHIVPVADHPAEFLAFVEKHNTITVQPLKPGLPVMEFKDWPVYSAYPEQSVLEIIGPRDDLPIPKTDRWATAVDRKDVQANILRGYRAERVRHYVLSVLDAAKARTWLKGKATPDESNGGAKPKVVLNIGLTYVGMQALGIRALWLATFPEAFRQGALARAADNFDTGSNSPDGWFLGGPQQAPNIHIVLSLYHELGAETQFASEDASLVAALPGAGLDLLATHDAFHRNGVSWFGYSDDIANPRIAEACPVPEEVNDLQPAASAGEFVLGANHKNIYGGNSLGALPAALATNGSFCAIRVLAQDRKAFGETVANEAARLGVAPDWLAAKLMGRWYKGAPLSLHPDTEPAAAAEHLRNDFDYSPSYEFPATPEDHFGERCPVGAHIRRANPRTARVAGARYARRLMRRGMHYEITDAQGQTEVGLFGLFICGDLERQFEFILRQWINGDTFASGLRGTRDAIIGTREGGLETFEIPRAGQATLQAHLPQFVFTRGSLYTFMPGLAALDQLDHFATADPPAAPAPLVPPAAPGELQVSSFFQQALQAALTAAGALFNAGDLIALAQTVLGVPHVASTPRAAALRKLRFDPRRRDFQADPYPVYASFRANERVHYSPLYDGWFVFGYDDVARVLAEHQTFSATNPNPGVMPDGMFTLDPPQHDIVREAVEHAWQQAATPAKVTPSIANSITASITAIQARGRCFDLVDDFARPVPRDVYFDILGGNGIDAGERQKLDAWARTVMKHHDHTLTELQRLDGFMAGIELVKWMMLELPKAAIPFSPYQGSFLMHMAHSVQPLGPLDPRVAIVTLVNLTVAGYMSVEFLLATGIRRLLLDKALGWDVVRNDPTKIPLFLREMRRTEHALSVVDRFTKQQATLNGVVIPPGKRVFGVLASANRDEWVYGSDADTFNPQRAYPKPHLALGGGAHDCMGRALEPMITEAAIGRLVAAMPTLRLQSGAQPPWFQNFYFRSFDHLRVTT